MRKIAVANRKGGVGKTTTSVNLSAGLSLTGYTVLLIDLDSQSHCSRLLGVKPEKTLADLMEGTATHSEAVTPARDRLFLLSSSKNLHGLMRDKLRDRHMRREYFLSEVLEPYGDKYDFAIIDTAPSFDEISVNVLFYANEVLIPVSMEALPVEGFIDFLGEINNIQRYSDIEIRYITPTFVDGRVTKSGKLLDTLRDHFPDKITPSIRYSVALSEAPAWKKTIYEYDKRGRASRDYMTLSEAIL